MNSYCPVESMVTSCKTQPMGPTVYSGVPETQWVSFFTLQLRDDLHLEQEGVRGLRRSYCQVAALRVNRHDVIVILLMLLYLDMCLTVGAQALEKKKT